MRKLLAYPLTLLYYLLFGLTLIFFHPLQWLALNIFGYHAHKKVVDALQCCLVSCLYILGTRISFNNKNELSTDKPVLIISNHQSMYDISPIMWFLRKHHVKFISKKELGKGIPSVSYNLRHGGSVLIDRKKPLQAVKAITDFAKYIEKTNRAAVIFPEGTRSKDGHPKPFRKTGLLTLMANMPSAQVLPITVNNSWKLLQYGGFPLGIGHHLHFTVHSPFNLANFTEHEALIEKVEQKIISKIEL